MTGLWYGVAARLSKTGQVIGCSLVILLGMAGQNRSVFAAPPVIFTLEEARRLAVEHRAELSIHEARIRAAQAQEVVAKSGLRPQARASMELATAPRAQAQLVDVFDTNGNEVTVSRVPNLDTSDPNSRKQFLPTYRLDAQAGVQWKLIDFGRTTTRRRAARAEKSVQEAQQVLTREELLDTVDEAYIGWLGATKQFEMLEASVARAKRRTADMKAKKEIGVVSSSEVLPLNYGTITHQLRASVGQQSLWRAQLLLEEALGGTALSPSSYPDMTLLDKPPVGRVSSAANSLIQQQIQAARARAEAVSSSLRPDIGVGAQLGVRFQESSTGRLITLPYYQVGLMFSVPIWDGGMQRGERRRAHEEVAALTAQAEVVSRRQSYQRKQLEIEIEGNKERLRLATALLAAASAIREDVESRIKEGAGTAQDLEQADERVARAEVEWLEARLERARLAISYDRF